MALRKTEPLGVVHVLCNTRRGGGFPIDNNISLGALSIYHNNAVLEEHARVLSFCSFNKTKDENLSYSKLP